MPPPASSARFRNYLDAPTLPGKDGSRIRALTHPSEPTTTVQSLTEVTVTKGRRTLLQRRLHSETLFHVLSGEGEITLGAGKHPIRKGDTICIPAGMPHCLQAAGRTQIRLLCCCAPASAQDDIELLEEAPAADLYGGDNGPCEAVCQNLDTAALTASCRTMRKRLGLKQTPFWQTIHVSQSAGSRYESGRRVPKQIHVLIGLAYGTDEIAETLLARLRSALPARYKPSATAAKAVQSGEMMKALRKRMGMTQTEFWNLAMVTQSGGARYESGRTTPDHVKKLLHFILCPEDQAKSMLTELRSRKTRRSGVKRKIRV